MKFSQTNLCLLISISLLYAQDTLRNVFVLWRHGDRAPYESYLNMTSFWPNGFTELTDKGIAQQFALGEFLRHEYKDFIPDHYHYSHYHLRSSDIDRALMSGQANAAGFYHNDKTPLPFGWRPIPIHTVLQENEYLFVHNNCPKLSEIISAEYKTASAKKFLRRFKDTTDKINLNLKRFFKPQEFGKFNDELVCLMANNATLPAWIDNKIKEDLNEISQHFWALRFSDEKNLILQSGIFFQTYREHIQNLIEKGSIDILIDGRPRKLSPNHIMAFSGHDTNVAAIMSGLGVPVPMPGYTSVVMLELHGPELPGIIDDFKIVVKYKHSFQEAEAKVQKLPICKTKHCEVKTLFDFLEKYSIKTDAYLKMCDGQSPPIVPDPKVGGYIAIAAFIICIVVPAITAVVYTFYKRRIMHDGYTNIAN